MVLGHVAENPPPPPALWKGLYQDAVCQAYRGRSANSCASVTSSAVANGSVAPIRAEPVSKFG